VPESKDDKKKTQSLAQRVNKYAGRQKMIGWKKKMALAPCVKTKTQDKKWRAEKMLLVQEWHLQSS